MDQPVHSKRPQPTARLSKTLSSISSSELNAVREEVSEEVAKLPQPSEPPPDFRHIDRPTLSNIQDLKTTGKIADEFLTGMDRVTDVLMVLVMKFGRASRLLVAVLALISLGLGMFTIVLVLQTRGLDRIEQLQQQQQEIQDQQVAILKQVAEASAKASAAASKAAAAEEAAPKVVLDDRGQAKLVIRGESKSIETAVPETSSDRPQLRAKGAPELEVPLDLK